MTALSNIDIEKFMHKFPKFKTCFLGCFSCDELANLNVRPNSGLVVNFDDSQSVGSHWIAIFIPTLGVCEYFDSFGREPPSGDIHRFVSGFERCLISKTLFQSPVSEVCGHYCLFYVTLRILGVSRPEIIRRLRDSGAGDQMVLSFYNMLCSI
jgi:hypothetical protein